MAGAQRGEPMVSEVRRDDDGPARRQEEAGRAVQESRRLLDSSEGWPPVAELDTVIDRLVAAETALAVNEEDFSGVFIVLGLMFGTRCRSRGDDMPSASASQDRAEALRRLRWADRHGPSTGPLFVQARMMIVFLLAPWSLPRPDGSRTVLQDALLTVGDDTVLTESMRQDLTEALEVVGRLAQARVDEGFARQTARVRRVIERMLAPGATGAPGSGRPPETGAPGDEPRTGVPDGTGTGDGTEDPESALFDAVRGLVALAGACSTARFTRVLVWLTVTLGSSSEASGAGTELELDPQAVALLDRAAAGRAAGVDGIRRAADLVRTAVRALPPEAPERARVARLHAYLLVLVEVGAPGSVDFRTVERPAPRDGEDGSRPADWPAGLTLEPGLLPHLDDAVRNFALQSGIRERRYAARLDRLLAYRTGDPGYLDDAATLLSEAVGLSPPDSWWVTVLRTELAELLDQAAAYGSLHDANLSLAAVRELDATLRHEGSLPLDAPFSLDLLLSTADRELRHAERTGDHEALPGLIEELGARHAVLPPDSGRRGEVAERLERLRALCTAGRRPAPGAGEAASAGPVDLAAEREDLARAIAESHRTLGGREMYFQQEYELRAATGLRMFLSVLRGLAEPGLLDDTIAELTRARELIAEGRARTQPVEVLKSLAEAHIMRAARRGPGAGADTLAFAEVTREALDELAADVLLQAGADHGLTAALHGAELSRRLAFVGLLTRRPADAVADLERGRALVHQAAAASRSIPELLEAAGHPELARRWRAQALADPLRRAPGDGAAPPAGSPPVPGALRHGALAALGVRPLPGRGPGSRRLAGPADVPALTAGLAPSGADALVYLVPGVSLPSRSYPGYALVLRPGAGPVMLPLPKLTAAGGSPLDRYLEAAAERSKALADPTTHASWRAAYEGHWQAVLDQLCDWAWPAAMGPVLSEVRPLSAAQWPLARPPRIVLVPCGRLGVVPWHAARIRGVTGHGHRYACQEAVLSYAPSGTQFLGAAGRRRIPPADGPQVLVADPGLTLPWAELEASAVRASCYPDALRYGEYLGAGEVPDAAGTPAELLAALPGGTVAASVIHLACHAMAAPRPTDSALSLAALPGADRDSGRLTVAGILDGATGPRPGAAGPLVVLSACETDLSTGHHDEALTLTTALITRGAADVVGSRWAVRDGATAVMMAVFHHHLTAGGLAPPDALRAAQLWMLNPRRRLPFAVAGPLGREAARPDLHRVHHWAAFTHQGSPAV
ncbi:CHAT domain-containing protein [Streptomyces sp. NPDC015171]|uniref:CHAT domain-containing protein n=1 Tax=Streptomyces sp. NPDC015171 TaxID=3364945 RepID=UPI0036F812EC